MESKIEKLNESFTPYKLTIVIESRNELLSLWHRFNISIGTLEDVSAIKKGTMRPDKWEAVSSAFNSVDYALKELLVNEAKS